MSRAIFKPSPVLFGVPLTLAFNQLSPIYNFRNSSFASKPPDAKMTASASILLLLTNTPLISLFS